MLEEYILMKWLVKCFMFSKKYWLVFINSLCYNTTFHDEKKYQLK